MQCSQCQHQDSATAKFCEECGQRLLLRCPACGFEPAQSAKFCPECGQCLAPPAPPAEVKIPLPSPQAYTPGYLAEKILTAKSTLEGERKQVTVLFADLKGSMELLADRDPEEARQLLDPVLERLMAAVHRYESTVNQVMGDGIMALFGAPLAHEDHAVRACYAALAERLGDDRRLGRIASDLGIHFSAMGEHDRAIAAGQRALALATSSGAFDVQVIAQNRLSQAYHTGGDFRQALDHARRAMALLTDDLRSVRFGLLTQFAVGSRYYVAGCLAELEDFAAGRRLAEDAVRIAEAAEQPFYIAAALLWAGWLSRRQGDFHQAIPVLERSLALCQTANLPRYVPMVASLLGAAYALAGRAAEALPLLDQVLERVAAGRRVIFHALVLTELSEALLLVGRVDEACALAGRLLDLSRTHIGPGYQAYAYRLLGETAACGDSPEPDQAAAHYHQALTLAEELGMRPLQAHCHLGLGTLYAKLGRPEQARAELSAAIELYRAMEMQFWLPQAQAALAQAK